VCCYDTHGIFSSPRVWWTFKVFGHKRVSVLDGGLPAWKRDGGRLESSPPEAYPATKYPVPQKDDSLVRSFEQITEIVQQDSRSVQILDARSVGRYVYRWSAIAKISGLLAVILNHAKVCCQCSDLNSRIIFWAYTWLDFSTIPGPS